MPNVGSRATQAGKKMPISDLNYTKDPRGALASHCGQSWQLQSGIEEPARKHKRLHLRDLFSGPGNYPWFSQAASLSLWRVNVSGKDEPLHECQVPDPPLGVDLSVLKEGNRCKWSDNISCHTPAVSPTLQETKAAAPRVCSEHPQLSLGNSLPT